jgi:ketosteroid isomerase-like protein
MKGRFDASVGRAVKERRANADIQGMKSSAARFVWLLILVGICVHARAQDTDDAGARSKVLALEHAWNQAEAFNDLKAMDSIFDNRLVYIDSDGTLMTKAEFLSHVKTSHLQQVITQSMTVQLFGDMAIVTGTYLVKEFKGGKNIQHRGRFVDAWVRKDQTWVCVAAEATPILP